MVYAKYNGIITVELQETLIGIILPVMIRPTQESPAAE